MAAADFYTGIVADLYGPLKAHTQRPEPYAKFITDHGEPALELGCGDGEPLLDLRAAGWDVDGVDSSADMLERCRLQAGRRGLQVTLHCQRMEQLDVPRRYRSIFLAGPTINLLPDDDTTVLALQRIHTHLTSGGHALIPTFVPAPAEIGTVTEQRRGDTVLRVTSVACDRKEVARTQTTLLRYEQHSAQRSEVVEREWILHWHTQDGFRELAQAAHLTVESVSRPDGSPAAADTTDVVYLLSR